ncbi:hypothetical protein NFI96_021018, partial [Prochilodus magdalenae]
MHTVIHWYSILLSFKNLSDSNGFRKLKSALSGKDTSVFLAQVGTYKPHTVEELAAEGHMKMSHNNSATIAISAESTEHEHLIGVVKMAWGQVLPTLSGSRISWPTPTLPVQPDSSHAIRVGFYETVEHHQIDTPPPPRLQELQAGDPTSWTLSDFTIICPLTTRPLRATQMRTSPH